MFISAVLGGRQCEMLIDTGASGSITNLPLPLTSKTIRLQGISGGYMTATSSEPVLLEIGDFKTVTPIWVCNSHEGTILGMDLLEQLGAVIDTKMAKIEWQKPFKRKRWGRRVRDYIQKVGLVRIERPQWDPDDPWHEIARKYPNVWAHSKLDCGRMNVEPMKVEGH